MKILIPLLLISSLLFSQKTILIDEDFNDWNDIPTFHKDPSNDNSNGKIDFKTFWVTNDDDYLYVRIQTTYEINLVDNNYMTIYIDSDNDETTGKSIDGIGAELEYTIGRRMGKSYFNNESSVYNRDIGFVGSPTFSGNDFEFVIEKDTQISGISLFQNDSIKIKFVAYTSSDLTIYDDIAPDSDGFEYIFKTGVITPYPAYTIENQNVNNLRIMSYNVERDGITETGKTTEFQHIFSTIQPQIIGLTEVYEGSSQQAADRIEFFLPSHDGEKWYNKKEGEYDIVLVSRFPIKQSFTIQSDIGHNASGAFLLDLNPKYDSKMLVIVSHPKCCSGDSENEKRQNQFDAIIAFLRDAVNPGGDLTIATNTPIVIMGDMNLVGDSRQYKTLITGDINYNENYGEDFIPDWDGSSFDDSIPFVTNTGMTYTTNPGNFPPGRLDFLVYSGSVMKIKNKFIFDTNKLTQAQLSQYGLNSADTEVSDHLPVVVDFELTSITDVKKKVETPKRIGLTQNYPNPFNPSTTFSYFIPTQSRVVVKIYDILGNNIETLVKEDKPAGNYDLIWNAANLASGIYLCRIQVHTPDQVWNYSETKKMILLE